MSQLKDFKVFTDEQSDDKEQEEQWQRARRLEKEKQLKKVLIGGAVGIGLLFVLLLSILGSTDSPEVIDDSHPQFTLIQSSLPHLKVLVDKKATTFQAKMMRGVGIVFPELLAWLEGNLNPNMKVVLIPDQNSGTALLAMAVAYYLKSTPLEVRVSNPEYQSLLKKNLQLMNQEHKGQLNIVMMPDIPTQSNYDLVVLENREWEGQFDCVGTFQKEEDLPQVDGGYQYLISKGKSNAEITELGRWNSYSMTIYSEGEKSWRTVLTKTQPDLYMNLCPETQKEFLSQEHFRSLVEFFRNKTISKIYLGIDSPLTLKVIDMLRGIGEVEQWSNNTKVETGEWVILKSDQVLQSQNKTYQNMAIQILNEEELKKVVQKMGEGDFLVGTNNNGCYYPPQVIKKANFPSFLILKS